ncbi:polysaccharide deacetylase family protein [Streptomyces sp. NBC_01190]|uniref:polysaccharide deacetylase family protein n=1 Tax=Streptomyces sp. NBC_01190 TaxID=2903767 RepID=UPI003869D5E0
MTADPFVLRRRPRTVRRAPWTLMYHSVGNPRDDPYLITVGPERLAAQLRWLNRHGLTGVSMRELLAARAAGRDRRLVGLTFDDGYADFLRHAVPALRQHGHTATLFVLPGRLGGSNEWDPDGPRKPLLDADGVREVVGAGLEIGSHGLLHRDLTSVDDTTLTTEVSESRALLADITGITPAGFCYPYGAIDPRAVEAVRRAGYVYGCAIAPGPLTSLLALPRTHVGDRDTASRLHAKRLLHDFRSRGLPEVAQADATVLAGGPPRSGAAGGLRSAPTLPRHHAGHHSDPPPPAGPDPLTDSPGGHP